MTPSPGPPGRVDKIIYMKKNNTFTQMEKELNKYE